MNSLRSAKAKSSVLTRASYGLAASTLGLICCQAAQAQLPAFGVTGAHDPSTLWPTGNNSFIYFATGVGLPSRVSTDMEHWTAGPSVFSTAPAWTTTAVPGANGDFWAPDVSYFDGIYHLYYAVSTFGSQVSAIGMATNTTLNDLDFTNYHWVDQGPVIQSHVGSAYNTIDPSVLVDTNGSVWMSFGSYWNGIYLTKLDPTTGKPISSATQQIADNSMIEASYLYHQGNYYYLFVNFGQCCMGTSSTYNIRVGRSTSVSGPYLDQNGVPMTQGGGTLLLGSEGKYIGPGQVGIMPQGNVDWMSYHYYDGTNNGAPTYALQQLYWTNNSWPTLTTPTAEGLTWDNATARGDGATWDVAANQNWQDTGGPAVYNESDAVDFNDANNGNYAVTLNTTVNPGSVVFNNSTGNYTVTGTGSISGSASLTKMGTGAVTLSTVNTYTGGTIVDAGTLVAAVAGALPNQNVTINGGTLQLATGIGTTNLPSLTIASGGALDVGNNEVILNDPAGTIDAAIRGYLINGYNGGAWNGTTGGAIITSATTGSRYGIGYADGADNVVTGLSSGQLEIKYTLYGDANLDGVVSGADFTILAENLGKPASAWDQGDFNYDGVVSGADFTLLVSNLGMNANGASVQVLPADFAAIDAFAAANGLMADVPEPATASVLAIGLVAILGRRRRQTA
jgi:autotransporter-associated beta strand protein